MWRRTPLFSKSLQQQWHLTMWQKHNVMLNHHCSQVWMDWKSVSTSRISEQQSRYRRKQCPRVRGRSPDKTQSFFSYFKSKGNFISCQTIFWQARDLSDNWSADRTMLLVLWPRDSPLLFFRFSRGATCHGSNRRKILNCLLFFSLAPGKDLVRDRWVHLLE